MNKDYDDLNLIKIEDIPKIPLYMDQVTGYLEEVFTNFKRNKDDKVLTKTMINNYVKAGILSSPEKKKYTSEQMMAMMMIYLLKNIVSIKEIETILNSDDQKKLYSNTIEAHENSKVIVGDVLEKHKDQSNLNQILQLLLTANLLKKTAETMIDNLGE